MALENAWTSHLGGISLCQLKLPKSALIQCALYQTTTLILILNKFDHLFAASVVDVPYSRVLQEHKNVARHRKLLSSKSPVPPAEKIQLVPLYTNIIRWWSSCATLYNYSDSAALFQKWDFQFPYSYHLVATFFTHASPMFAIALHRKGWIAAPSLVPPGELIGIHQKSHHWIGDWWLVSHGSSYQQPKKGGSWKCSLQYGEQWG